jgi:hypothetical protein
MKKELLENDFDSLADTVERLGKLIRHPNLKGIDYIQDAVIYRFKFCMSLYWKILKKFLSCEEVKLKRILTLIGCAVLLGSTPEYLMAGGSIEEVESDKKLRKTINIKIAYKEACDHFAKGLPLFKAARGRGLAQLYGQAYMWFAEADKLGHVSATFNLGLMHEFGLGAPLSYPMALAYYEKARCIYQITKSFEKVQKMEEAIRRIREKMARPAY